MEAMGLPISLDSFHYTSPAAPLPGDSLIGGLRLSPATARILEGTNSSSSALPMGLREGDRGHEFPGDLTCHILLKTSPCRTLSLIGPPCTPPFNPRAGRGASNLLGKVFELRGINIVSTCCVPGILLGRAWE